MIEIIFIVIVLATVLWFTRNILSPLLIVLIIFILAWLLWYGTGGVERFEKSNRGIFIRPTENYKGFETYGSFPEVPLGTSTKK